MIQIEFLSEIVKQQESAILVKDAGMKRDQLELLPDNPSHALIVSGIRRCGKSTLLYQLLRHRYPKAVYVNFDDPRLYDFSLSDFVKFDKIIETSGESVLMFDEIQLIPGWERYVRQKLDQNYHVFVTGSNASMLSRELGSSLTGRHISKELYPFSYAEYCRFHQLLPSAETTNLYMADGGFPEFQKQKNTEILTALLDDVVIRDIAVRYNIRDVKSLQRLTLFLLSNIGNRISGNKLKDIFGISSTTTILEYFSHLEQSYLLAFVPLFNFSLKKQNINPRKVYAIDTGLVAACTPVFTKDYGHKFENLVYLSLRRHFPNIYYYSQKNECDFLVMDKGIMINAIQVCIELTNDNLQREMAGLLEAMHFFNLKEGIIITLAQTDHFVVDGLNVRVFPFHIFAFTDKNRAEDVPF